MCFVLASSNIRVFTSLLKVMLRYIFAILLWSTATFTSFALQ